MRGRKAKGIRSKLCISLFGDTGSGKTKQALEFAKFKREDGTPYRVGVIDAEGGGTDDELRKMEEEQGIDVSNVYVWYTQSLQEVLELIEKIKNKETLYELDDDGNYTDEPILDGYGEPFKIDALVVDGSSVLKMASQQGLIELSKKRNAIKADKAGLTSIEKLVKVQDAAMELKDYNTLNFSGQNLILELMALGVDCAVTSREKNKKNTVKDNKGSIQSIDTGEVEQDSYKGIDYNCNVVIHTVFNKETGDYELEIIKDRTGVHAQGDIITNGSILDYAKLKEGNKGKSNFVLNNALNQAVEAEQKMYEKQSNSYIGEETLETKNEEVSEKSYQSLIKDNIEKIVDKKLLQKTLRDNNLPATPIAIKKVTDEETLKKIFEVTESLL